MRVAVWLAATSSCSSSLLPAAHRANRSRRRGPCTISAEPRPLQLTLSSSTVLARPPNSAGPAAVEGLWRGAMRVLQIVPYRSAGIEASQNSRLGPRRKASQVSCWGAAPACKKPDRGCSVQGATDGGRGRAGAANAVQLSAAAAAALVAALLSSPPIGRAAETPRGPGTVQHSRQQVGSHPGWWPRLRRLPGDPWGQMGVVDWG